MKRADRLTVPVLGLAIFASASAALADGGRGGNSSLGDAGGAGGGSVSSNGGAGGSGLSGGGGGGGGVNFATGLGGSGGAGGAGPAPNSGGRGGDAGNFGVIVPSGTVNNASGTAGGNGVLGIETGGGGGGGEAGGGLLLSGPGTATVAGTVAGGAAGAGGTGGNAFLGQGGSGGSGGKGGTGALVTSPGSLVVDGGRLIGGNGGDGGTGGSNFGGGVSGSGGDGGAGGAGAMFTGGGQLRIVSGSILGGLGGVGANPGVTRFGTSGLTGSGGAGGTGVSFTGNGSITLESGSITGGQGRQRTAGGDGIRWTGQGTLLNAGTIQGGLGGLSPTGFAAAGGTGVTGSNLVIVNSGAIAGGLSGDGLQRSNAVTFNGGTNIFELRVGSTTLGNVVAFSTADTFRLGGATNGTFDVSQLGPAAQFRGFGINEKSGSSTWTLAGTTGSVTPWTINAGTLSISSDGNLGAAAGALTFGGGTLETTASFSSARNITLNTSGTLQTDAGVTTVLSGVIANGAGAGSLTKTGTGVLTLSGANTYTGTTTINAGTLSISSDGNLGAAPGALTFGGGTLETTASFSSARNITLNTSGIFQTDAGVTTVLSGVIANGAGAGSLTKTGTGVLMLSGANTYTGSTTVNAGTLSVNGSTASSSLTTVNSGGTLGGNGTVGNTTISGGTLAPGNSIGTLTVQGNLVFTAAASYMVEVSPANADRTNVTGTATLGGATVNASFAAGTYVSKQYTIVNATGGVIGTFNSVVNTNVPSNFTSSLSYDANNAYLNLVLNFVPNPAPNFGNGLNVNQQNVANTLVNFFNSTGGIPLVFGSLTPTGLTQVSGELPTAAQQTTFDAMNLFLGLLTDPFVAGRGNPVSSSAGAPQFADENDTANAYASNGKPRTKSERDAYAAVYRKAPMMADPFTQRWSVWAAGYGGSQTTDGNTVLGSNNTRSSIGGVAVGADYRFSPNMLAGFALAGGATNFSVNGSGSGRSDLFQAGAFVRHTAGPAYLSAALAYGWQDITTDRTVSIAGTDVLRAKFNANAFSGRVEGGYRFVSPWMAIGITPYAAGQATTFELPAYAEQAVAGANTFALTYGAKDVTASRSELGLRSDKSYAMQDGIFTLRGRAAWAHNFNTDRNVGATFQTLPGASFVVNGAKQASDSALVTGSAEMKWLNGFSLAGTFEGEFSNVTASYAGKGVVRYAW